MTDDEYQVFIHKIANEIDRLVINPKIRKLFADSIVKLYDMAEKSGVHLERCTKDPKFRINVEDRLKFEKQMEQIHSQIIKLGNNFNVVSQTGDEATLKEIDKQLKQKNQDYAKLSSKCYKPPAPGCVEYDYLDWDFLTVSMLEKPCWLKPGAVNPLLWFDIFGNANIQRKPTEDEKLVCQYVLLAIIHDYELRHSTDSHIFSKDYKGKWFARDRFCIDVWEYYHYRVQEVGLHYHLATSQEKLSQLNRTLEHVKADIEKQLVKLNSGNAGDKKKPKKKLKPLSDKTAAVLELLKTLPEHRGMTGPKILETLDARSIHIDQSTLTKNIIPELRPHGVKNKPRIGYYIVR